MENDKVKFKNDFKVRIYSWVIRLIKFIDGLPKDSTCLIMGKHLLRSGTSVLANFVEAQSASSTKDFINFFTHSLKSANESKVWLALLRDVGKGNSEELKFLLKKLTGISNILTNSILTLKKKR